MSVRLQDLKIGEQTLPSQKFYSVHKNSLQQSLSNLFSKAGIELKDNTPFEVKFGGKQPVLRLNGKVTLLGDDETRNAQRVVRYYQNIGQLKKEEEACPIIHRATRKTVKEMRKAKIPGASGKAISGMHVTEDTLGLIRNAIYSIAPDGSFADRLGDQLGYYTGLFSAFFAFKEIEQGMSEYKRAMFIGDEEGKRRAQLRFFRGGLVSTGSAAYLAHKLWEPALSASASLGLTVASQVCFGFGSLVNVGTSALGALRCYRFNERLNEYLFNPNLTEEQRLSGALEFLKDEISVTADEKEEILAKINPSLPAEERTQILIEEIAKLTELKVKHLKRRTSNQSLLMILKHVDPILVKLKNPATAIEGMQEAAVLLTKLQMENKTKFNLHSLSIVAGLLGLIGMLLFILVPFAALPFIFYGIAGTIYLGTSIYTAVGIFQKKQLEIEDDGEQVALSSR
jgi:hypothetical protein